MFTILGAGLSGLSVADHLSKKNIPFELYEAKSHGGGHIASEVVDGFTWDEGPHVSFTKYDYVKDYFAENCGQEFLEYPTYPTNYFKGNWIAHPAQANLYAVPEPLRSECISSVKAIREELSSGYTPADYQEWIDYAFGKKFAAVFPEPYTLKYWTTEARNLTTDWIGKRIYFPEIKDMVEGAAGPLVKQTHYISKVRYPAKGGFYSFIKKVEEGLPVFYNKNLEYISFDKKELFFSDGSNTRYDRLINTLPLTQLIQYSDAPAHIKEIAFKLKCSQLLLINVVIDHPPAINNHWIYVYDSDFYSTRINFTDLLSPHNGLAGKSGIQVEVYFSDYHPPEKSVEEVVAEVLKELVAMKLARSADDILTHHHKWIGWANVIFDKNRKAAQNEVLTWLESKGLKREADDLEPMTDWETKTAEGLGDIILAGRFAQWKYFWTDDCVMRGKYISESVDVS